MVDTNTRKSSADVAAEPWILTSKQAKWMQRVMESNWNPLLTIGILTIKKRLQFFVAIKQEIFRQIDESRANDVEVIAVDGEDYSTRGEARNHVLDYSRGEYVCFVDDDDKVSPNYVKLIRNALQYSPDCVGIKMNRYLDGEFIGQSVHSIRYTVDDTRSISGPRIRADRIPNHINPVKRELAMQVRFKPIDEGEDTDYAKRLRPLLKNEVMINEPIYSYMKRTKRACVVS